MAGGRPKQASLKERRTVKREAETAAAETERARVRAAKQAAIARAHLLVDPEKLAPDNSYGTPDFVKRGHYVDVPFVCASCGTPQVWTEAQQKWWYEVAKGNVWTIATRCRPCRKREQARRAAARTVHLEGVAAKRAKKA